MTSTNKEKISKLKILLSQVPKGTPTYDTIKGQLEELIAQEEKTDKELSAKSSESKKTKAKTSSKAKGKAQAKSPSKDKEEEQTVKTASKNKEEAKPPTLPLSSSEVKEVTTESENSTSQTKEKTEEDKRPVNDSIFQAIGLIKGRIVKETVLNEQGEERTLFSVMVEGKKYRVRIEGYKFIAFLKQFTNNSEQEFYLLVYPYLQFIPKQQPELRFQIVSWQDSPYDNFSVNEFNIRGIWQFIPQYRRPLISIMRNWMEKEERKKLLEKGQDFKGNHIPIMWRDAPVLPFRFNPREKDQAARYFVELKAKFLSKFDSFGVQELLSEPTTTFPRYLLSKRKMEQLGEKKKAKKEKEKKLKKAQKIDKQKQNRALEKIFYVITHIPHFRK